MKPTFLTVAILALMCEVVSAQSPYAGQRDAPIKALLPEEQSALRAGQGLGFAMAAELNGYPGPKHVLELAEQLELSDDQRRATQEIFERMLATAQREGAALIEAERELDGLYASRTATAALVNERLTRIEQPIDVGMARVRVAARQVQPPPGLEIAVELQSLVQRASGVDDVGQAIKRIAVGQDVVALVETIDRRLDG